MKRKQVLAINHKSDRYAVTLRATLRNDEPGFAVYRGADIGEVIAHFFNETDAGDYAEWKNQET